MVIFFTPMTMKVADVTPWIYHFQVNKVKAIDAPAKWTVSGTMDPFHQAPGPSPPWSSTDARVLCFVLWV